MLASSSRFGDPSMIIRVPLSRAICIASINTAN